MFVKNLLMQEYFRDYMKKLFFLCSVTLIFQLNAMWSDPDFITFATEYYKTQEEQQNHDVMPGSDTESVSTDSALSDEEAMLIFDSFN